MYNLRRSYGFSLVELLVVIGIIAILAAILFPTLTAAKERVQRAKCASNLKQIAASFKMYGVDWEGKYPDVDEGVKLQIALQRYVAQGPTGTIWRCPMDTGIYTGNPYARVLPAYKTSDYGGRSYGWPGNNYKLINAKGGRKGAPYLAGLRQDNPVVPGSEIKPLWLWQLPLSKRFLMFDLMSWHSVPRKGDAKETTPGYVNVVCCDGHTQAVENRKFYLYLFAIDVNNDYAQVNDGEPNL